MRTHRSAQRMPDRPAWRRPLARATAVLAIILLSACGAEYDVVIHDDDTVDLTYTLWDSSGLGLITEETCTQETMSSYPSPLPQGTQAAYTYTTHGKNPACEISGSSIPLSELEGQEAVWSVTHEGREYVFSLSPSELSQAGIAETAGGITAAVSVTFPGQVSSANGEIDGSTVTWRGVTSSSERLVARGHDGSITSASLLLIAISSLALIAVPIIVVSVVVSRRRKQARQAALQRLMQDPSAAPGPAPAPDLPSGQHLPGQPPAPFPGHGQPSQPPIAGIQAPGHFSPGPGLGLAQAPLEEPYPQSPTPGSMPPTSPYQASPPVQAATPPQTPHPYDPQQAPYYPPDLPTADR